MAKHRSPPSFLFVYRFCGLGGVETSLLNKAKALERAGAALQVLFTEPYGVGGIGIAKQPWARLGLPKAEVKSLLREEFDAIVVIDYPEFMNVIEGIPVRSRVFFESHSSLPGSLPHFYSRLRSSRLTAVVVPSEFNKRRIEASGSTSQPIVVIPNPLDTEVFHPLPRGRLGDRFPGMLDAPVILWVGRLEDEKNPAEFLAVASAVLQARPESRFLMVGDTPKYAEYRERLEQQLQPALRAQLSFMRSVENERMPELYSLAAVTGGCLVSTSLHEAQPMSFLEAMACGCPIVASRVDGVPELVADRDTGRLYPLGDVAAAADAVRELLDPTHAPARVGLVERGLALVRREHSLARGGRCYLSLLEQFPAPVTPPTRQPLVSGIIIFLNGENFLREAIESVLAQTYPHWELLLVDDGSTDSSTALARDYAARYPGKIHYLEHEGHRNRGKSASRNVGLQHARGEYIALLDHDDIWLPQKLADQVAVLEARPDAAMTYGSTRFWHSWTGDPADQERDGMTVLGVEPDTLVQPPDLITLLVRDERSVASPCSVLIRRDIAQRVGGFPESFHSTTYDDVAFLTQIYLEYPVFVADGCWDLYRQHRNNATATARRIGEWHPNRPNPRREMLLTWIDSFLKRKECTHPELLATLETALLPYRHPPARSAAMKYCDTALDATLALLRGEDPRPLLARHGDESAADLDPQAMAEHIFDAVPQTTWNAPSLWLEFWPRLEPQLVEFLELLEAQARVPALARRAHCILAQLIAGDWLLRVAAGNRARLVLRGEDSRAARVEIAASETRTGWDIQLNWMHLELRGGRRYVVNFEARAEQPRNICFGVARGRDPWDNLGLYRRIKLTPEWQRFRDSFTATSDEDNARIHFDLGEEEAAVEVSEPELGPEPAPGASPAGNYEDCVVLLARSRSGTNALRSVLETNPEIFCLDEVFAIDGRTSELELVRRTNFFNFLARRAAGEVSRIFPDRHAELFFTFLDELRQLSPRRILLFDVKYTTVHLLTAPYKTGPAPLLYELILTHGLRVLNLTRRNYVRYLLSQLKAEASGVWYRDDRSRDADTPLALPLPELLPRLEQCATEDAFIASYFAGYSGYLRYDYEEVFPTAGAGTAPAVLDSLSRWLGVANSYANEPALLKQSQLPLEQSILNWTEVAAALAATPFAYCLEDEQSYRDGRCR